MLKVEAVTCQHREQITSTPALPGVEIGTCSDCGQRVQYNSMKSSEKPVVLKLGRIDGKPVMPKIGYILRLDPQDMNDLAVATGQDELIEPVVPPRPKKGKGYLKRVEEYYEQNKVTIIQDYYLLGRRPLFARWGLNSTVWMKLQKRWKVEAKGQTHRFTGAPIKTTKPPSGSIKEEAPKGTTSGDGTLPPFPAFDNSWADPVKIEWIKTYKEITLGNSR